MLGERYRILSTIGSGGSAVVYRAHDERESRDVAAKLVEAPALRRPVRFMAEVRDMAQLRHPRIVPVLDAGSEAQHYWMIMPLMRRGSLKDVVSQGGTMAPERALHTVFQVLQGLHAVHSASLIHRDIKPHNVLLDKQGAAYLTDFGLARHLKGDVPYKTLPEESLGSPSYRAPEQARSASSAGREADLYGIGGMLYWVLTGKRPGFFYMMEEDELTDALRQVPDSVRPVIRTATQFKPEARYRTSREMAGAVACAYDGLPNRDGGPVSAAWMARFETDDSDHGLLSRLGRWLRGNR